MRLWLLLALTLDGIVALGAQTAAVPLLAAGVPIDDTVAADQARSYQIVLAQGDFALVEIRKTLYFPLVEVVDPSGASRAAVRQQRVPRDKVPVELEIVLR